jgi:dTDP-4-amino-4,6-dideoxygalactose transaminase
MSLNVPFGDWKRQYEHLRAELDAAALRVMRSGMYVLGPETRAFEEAFAAFCGARYAIGVGNGTEALALALVALGVGLGDEVITVANAASYDALVALRCGARPVFVDVDASSYNLDPALLEAAMTPRTKAIMPVHLYGRAADMRAIMRIADRHGVPVIEDCAQAHGALLDERPVGTWGVCGCFSFYPSKNLGAIGDGGAVITNDAAFADKLRKLRQYGWQRKYYISEPGGGNSRLDEIQAALLNVKLPHLPAWNERRREIARMYTEQLADTGLSLPAPAADGAHVHHLYVVCSTERDALQAALREYGVATDIHYPQPSHKEAIFAQYAPSGGLPVTERLAREVLSLPIYPEMTDDEVDAVIAAVRRAVKTRAPQQHTAT